MSHTIQWPSLHRAQHMNLSFCAFTFWWLIIITMHLLTCAYNFAYAKLYWGFEQTMFSFLLLVNEIGMAPQYYHTIAYVYVALATVHGACALSMMGGSLWRRFFVFLWRSRIHPSKKVHGSSPTNSGINQHGTEVSTRSARVVRFLSAAYHRVASQHGVLGVKGEHFHVILICREVVEMALQTAQAIRMSKYLPRLLLNRFYVSLLAINCCSPVFVYSRWFSHNEARRRFVAILCDCILNLITTIGVSLIIMLSYVHEYDINNFKWQLLEDDEWVAQTLNESRVILVQSWADISTRAFFSLGLIAATTDMKSLLSYSSNRVKQVGPSMALIGNLGSVGRSPKQHKMPIRVYTDKSVFQKNTLLVGQSLLNKGSRMQNQRSSFILHGIHASFALWGVTVLALHLHASMQAPLPQCTPKVFPMAGALPSCYAVDFDCHKIGILATKDEVVAEWGRFDRATAVKLRILHCQSLEMADNFQDFSALQEILIYNSTILDWDDTAAITNTHHSKLRQISILRVNMTGGYLPLGFQSRDFPSFLLQINFCKTNLENLPPDLFWPVGSVILFESGRLATIPPAFVQSPPYYLALTGNPLTDLPPELFEVGVALVYVGHTGINKLPEIVTPTVLSTLDITNTNISFFPLWIDSIIDAPVNIWPIIIAGGSAYCSDLEKIMNGESSSFSASFHPNHSTVLMNASEANWDLLRQIVDCSPPLVEYQYSFDHIDSVYALEVDGDTKTR